MTSAVPRLKLAVLACMDARFSVHALLGLADGDAHVIRNAGGAATDDAIRSLSVSQHLLGTREIVLIHHQDCGMRKFTDTEFARRLESSTGIRPGWAAETFTDPAQDVRQCIARLRASPFLAHTEAVRGYVLDEPTGELTEVD
ncbi:carbonic anhydrase [Amycolatopsis sp. OK19-0408]|uniref:carbonic anhydrase n=1 Tax=Amycolatopsis iheyensis TaxID=2945988 RepID=A0A9X2N8S8_9PSEU|nr:carbonic anhydrase [Amycolatopsis iheyensis]MCR6482465.1 carbonic anhydrase [Amycolatopsis iheyensis]